MIIPQRAAHFGQLYQNDNQKVELNEYQVEILEVSGIYNVNVENIDGDKLDNQDENDDKFDPRMFQKIPSVQRIEQQSKIFRHIEEKTAVNE